MAHILTSPVAKAVLANDVKKLMKLIKSKSPIDVKDNLGFTPLHIAVQKMHGACVDILLKQPKCPIDEQNYEGCTSLFLACAATNPSLRLVKKLLDHDANPNIGNNEEISPLHVTCQSGNLEVLKLLVDYGGDVNQQDLDNYSCLHFAVHCNLKHIVEYLIEIGADTNLVDDHHLNPMMLAIVRSFEDIFEILLPHTANLNQKTRYNFSALCLAIQRGTLGMVHNLVENGACTKSGLFTWNVYLKDNFDMFEYIWSKTDHPSLIEHPEFISVLTNTTTIDESLKHLLLILKTPNLNLKTILKKNKHVFHNMFIIRQEDIPKSFINNNKENIIFVIKELLENGAVMNLESFDFFLRFVECCPYRLDLLTLVLNHTKLTITPRLLHIAFVSHPDLGRFLLKHAPYNFKPYKLYKEFIDFQDIAKIKSVFEFFTPKERQIQEMFFLVEDSEIIDDLNGFVGKVQSLKELARNVSRKAIGTAMHLGKTCDELPNAVSKLLCPQMIKDIILYKEKINIL